LWNPDEERLAERVIPALALEVAVNPAFGAGSAAAEPSSRGLGRTLLVGLAVLLLSGWMWLQRDRWLPGMLKGRTDQSRPPLRGEHRTGRLLPLNPRREV
jgi:hypothetical protein